MIWNVLQASPLFKRLSSYQKTWIESILHPINFDGEGVLIEEGKPIDHIFIINDGEVLVSQNKKPITTLERGDFIGAMHKVHRGESADYTFSHTSTISLLSIKKEDVLEFVNKNPGVGMMFTKDF